MKAYAREAEANTLELLDSALTQRIDGSITREIQNRLLSSAARDIQELRPQLEPRAEELAKLAIEKLRARGEREARDLREILERQRKRVEEELAKHEKKEVQLYLDFTEDEQRQLDANIRSWRTRIEQFERDLSEEPDRIKRFYEVRARRVEPVGLVYLWPETN